MISQQFYRKDYFLILLQQVFTVWNFTFCYCDFFFLSLLSPYPFPATINRCYYGILPLFGPTQPPGIDLFHVGPILTGNFHSLISPELFQGCCFQLTSKLKSKPLSWLSTLVLGIPEFQLSSRDLSFFGQVDIPSHWLQQRPIRVWSWFWILFLWLSPVVSALLEPQSTIPAPIAAAQLENGRCLKVETTFAAPRFVPSPPVGLFS